MGGGGEEEVGITGTRSLSCGGIPHTRDTPPLLTPSGGHHVCGWQAGGTHSTGMLSCSNCIISEQNNRTIIHSKVCPWFKLASSISLKIYAQGCKSICKRQRNLVSHKYNNKSLFNCIIQSYQ